ncbi:BNR repeat-containing protein, partial [Akkermansiaceae bacterium]|nr:BNR repeat-containing protein [Akkermansiaceae bacterium]
MKLLAKTLRRSGCLRRYGMLLALTIHSVAAGAKATEQSLDGKGKQDKVSAPMVNNAWGNLYKFHQSRAHYHSGKTYLAWVGPDNHPYVSVYSHKKNEWSSHERVGTNLISPKDYHGNPSILIDREGFLHVF